MRQKYTPDMMMEEVMIAFTTGRCPRCGQVLQVRALVDGVQAKCGPCGWEAGGSFGFFEMLEEVTS